MSHERASIRDMHGYAYGEQPSDARTIKLNTNENPYPPSPAVAAALADFDVAELRRYPSALATGLRARAAATHAVSVDNILATNGGDELLRLAVTTFIDPGGVLGTTEPSYSLYPVLAAVQDARVATCPFANGWDLPADFGARMNAAGAQLVCVVNPHAPSGALFDVDRMRSLAAELDGVLLIDEAYVDFVDPDLGHDCTPLVREFDNVLLLRTLSKGYSLAGLRCGYGIGSAGLIEPMLTKTRDSYNIDAIAQRLAEAALGDRAYAQDTWRRVRMERSRLAAALAELGFSTPPSHSNFLLARVPTGQDGSALMQALRARHILVRWFDSDGLRDCLRITVGTPAENDTLLAALGELVRT